MAASFEARMQGIQATLDRYAREQEEKVAEERKLIEQVPLKDRRSVFPGSFGARGEATRDLRGVARKLAAGEATRVVVLAGAGMSVSAGIPDFRSPDGLYALLGQQQRGGAKTADPSGVFRMGCFKKDPVTTNAVLRAMVPDSGRYSPTPAHYFAKMLHERGLLQKLYTQNVDALERAAGLPEAKVVYAHGGFHGAHCIEHGPASKRFSSLGRDTGHGTPCNAQYSLEEWRAAVENPAPGDAAGVLRCCARTGPRGGDGRRAVCGGLVKPDITFFGEQTSALSLYDMIRDMEQADLVIVMGTSLAVHPFNKLVVMTGKTVPRVLINREQVGAAPVLEDGFAWDLPDLNYRDVFLQGDCDAVVTALCQAVDAEAAAAPPAPPPPAAAAATAARGGAAAAAAAAAVDQGSWAEHLERLVEAGPQSDVWQMLLEQQPAGIRPAGR